MIKKIPYTCRFCGANHLAEYDDECPGIQLEKWMAVICCNKCAEFREEKRTVMDGIAASCRAIQVGTFRGGRLKPEEESKVRAALERLTKRYADMMCDWFGLVRVWDKDFVEQLMEKPDKWGSILKLYNSGLRSLKTGSIQL